MKTHCEIQPGKQTKARNPVSTKPGRKGILFLLAALVLLPLPAVRAVTVYAVADNSTGVNFFGTLDVATGQFTKIADTTPLFYAISGGPGGVLYGADLNSGNLFTISTSGATAQFGSVKAPDMFQGLAYSESSGDFFADDVGTQAVTLYSITGDGSSDSSLKQLDGPGAGEFPTGNLAYGPDQKLYFNYSNDQTNATNSKLYVIDPSTGTQTVVGSGLGTQILVLFSDGTTLYGVDTFITENVGIYTIDTTSGVATRVATVTGLPSDNSYYIDAAAAFIAATPPVVTVVAAGDGMAVEGGEKNGKLSIVRTGDTSLPLTVSYKAKGSAQKGVDYKPLSGSVTIPAGASKAHVKIKPLDNPEAGTRKVKIKLLPASDGSYETGNPSQAKITVIDNG